MISSHTKLSTTVRQFAVVSLMSGSIGLLAGCGSYPESHVVSAPPPSAPATQVVVAQQPQQVSTVQTANGGTIIVMQAPPAQQQEVVIAQPSSQHKWVAGYWTWRNNRYEWMAGHWEVPPTSTSAWVSPRWERTSDGGYRFYEGYWN